VEEAPLGGNLQDAVRIGDTVHRRAGPWTPSVHALLRYLEGVGFPAPRVVGMDAQGREVLRYVEGEAYNGTNEPLPRMLLADNLLVGAAKLLRRYHDVVTEFRPPSDPTWRLIAPTTYEVICHNDWSPWNAVLRGGHVEVMLDWDLAGPGTRVWDVANAAYAWVPLIAASHLAPKLPEQIRRLRLFLDSYGLRDRSELLLTMRSRLLHVSALIVRAAAAGDTGMQRLVAMGAPQDMVAKDVRWLDENWPDLECAL
jgi:aminoglycoside phosphotransferase (APT) family kinase protein